MIALHFLLDHRKKKVDGREIESTGLGVCGLLQLISCDAHDVESIIFPS